jgi:hypothetical protein
MSDIEAKVFNWKTATAGVGGNRIQSMLSAIRELPPGRPIQKFKGGVYLPYEIPVSHTVLAHSALTLFDKNVQLKQPHPEIIDMSDLLLAVDKNGWGAASVRLGLRLTPPAL